MVDSIQKREELGIQFGKYLVYSKLAVGGMAELYLARQPGLAGFNKTVVLKCILPNLAQEDQFVTMFLDEARVASHLDHPNIVQIHDIGEILGIYYIAMEYIRGKSLKDLRKRIYQDKSRKEPPYTLIAGVIAQTAAGLDCAHSATDEHNIPIKLVHRDISPTNVLVSYNGAVKIVDFGVAKATIQEHKTNAGMTKGKYRYMSPEQLAGKDLDHRSDIFSLGIVLYELSTNIGLFKRRSEIDTIQAVGQARVVPPSKLHPNYPPELEAILMKALQREPAKRYQNADEFRLALEEFVHHKGSYFGQNQLSKEMQHLFSAEMEGERTGVVNNPLTRADFFRLAGSISMADHMTPSPSHQSLGSLASYHTQQPQIYQAPPSGLATGQVRGIDGSSTLLTPSTSHPQLTGASSLQDLSGISTPPGNINSLLGNINDPSSLMAIQNQKSKAGSWLLVFVLLFGCFGVGAYYMRTYLQKKRTVDFPAQMVIVERQIKQKKYIRAEQQLQSLYGYLITSKQRSWYKQRQQDLDIYPKLDKANRLFLEGLEQRSSINFERSRVLLNGLLALWPNNTDIKELLKRVNEELKAIKEEKENPLPKPLGEKVTAKRSIKENIKENIKKVLKKNARRNVKKNSRRHWRRRLKTDPRKRQKIATIIPPPRQPSVRIRPVRIAPPKPRPPRKGFLYINASPVGQVRLSGNLIGFTPINGYRAKPGIYKIKVSRTGYFPHIRRVTIRSSRKTVFTVELKRIVSNSLKPRQTTPPKSVGKRPRFSFSSSRLPRRQKLRLLLFDPRGHGGLQHTNALNSLCSRIESDVRRLMGSAYPVKGVTRNWARYIKRKSSQRRESSKSFYPRAVAYVIYSNLKRGRSKRRVTQLLVSYELRNRFKNINK